MPGSGSVRVMSKLSSGHVPREHRTPSMARRWRSIPVVPAPGASATDQLRGEAAAWRARESVEAQGAWALSRWKCAGWSLAMPILIVAVTWFVLAFGYLEPPATAPDPEQQAFQNTLVAITVGIVFGVFSLIVVLEFGRLALFGGGFTALPDGLHFRFGRRRLAFDWADVREVAVERRSASTVLVIRFRDGGIRWPRAMTLYSSTTDTLCISAQLFADPAEGIAAGIRAAREHYLRP